MSGLVDLSADARSKTIGQNFRIRAGVYANDSAANGSFETTKYFNVSSVGISGASGGNYYNVNFATAMPHDDYVAVVGSGRLKAGTTANMDVLVQPEGCTRSTTTCEFQSLYANSAPEFCANFNVLIMC
jgi:hypothetical protein|tara:strand:- start:948 stop:1334 length:387 start_codon:yes stop_codon:yes gene_type:complete